MKLWKPFSERKNKKDSRIFIVAGGRRTGTTLLTSIMCSNPRANSLGQEAQILTRIVESYKWSIDNFKDFGSSFFPDKQSLTSLFQNHVANYIQQVSSYSSPGGILVLKNPEISIVMEYLYALLPNAMYLATIRDPRDQIAAELEVVAKRRAAQNNIKSQSRNTGSLIKLYKNYLEGILTFKRQYPHSLFIIRYEDLVQHSETTISLLENHTRINIPFNPSEEWPRVSRFAGLDTVSPSSSPLYGKPISDSSVGRYKKDLYEKEINTIENAFQHFMTQYGYF